MSFKRVRQSVRSRKSRRTLSLSVENLEERLVPTSPAALALAATQLAKPVVAPGSFAYLGSFDMPTSAGGVDTAYAAGGLTYRYVNGQLQFFTTSHVNNGGLVYETNYPGLGTGSSMPQAQVVHNWGDVYTGQKWVGNDGGFSGLGGAVSTNGLYYDQATNRLYWNYGYWYNATNPNNPSFGYSVLNDATGVATGQGAWSLANRYEKFDRGGTLAIPQWFANAYTGGDTLGVGFGGYYSIVSTASFGPALAAVAPPDPTVNPDDSALANVPLLGYPDGTSRAQRDPNYTSYYDNGTYPTTPGAWNPSGGTGYWTWSDIVGGATWIDTPNMQGVLFIAKVGQGNVWYQNSDRHAQSGAFEWMVYDPNDLAAVASGAKQQWQIQPKYEWTTPTLPIGPLDQGGWSGDGNSQIGGVTFDPTTNRLYILVEGAWQGGVETYPEVYAYQVGAPATTPQARVLDGSTTVANGGSDNFGSALASEGPLSKTFVVTNYGSQTLTLNPSITLPAGFSLKTGFGSNSLTPGATTTFTVQMTTVPGTYSGNISFGTNDPNNNPYTFSVSGSVASGQMIEYSAATGFTATSGWTYYSDPTFDNGELYTAAGNGSQVATWTFAVTPGQYSVAATWGTNPNRATNAPYTILDGNTPLGTVPVNQQSAPSSFTDQGTGWQNLGNFTVKGNSLVVQLSNAANQYVIANAIRIASVGAAPPAPVAQVLDGLTAIGDRGSDNFGSTPAGTPLSKTFTVTNAGTASLTLGSTITLPAGLTLKSGFGSTSLAPGASTTFTVQLTAAAAGTYSGAVSFTTSDPANNPYTFTLTGTVTAPPAPLAQLFDGATLIADGTGSDTFGSTPPGTAVSKTLTVTNNGTATLTLGNTITLPTGFTLTSGFGSTSLAPGASTTFTVQMSAASVGSYSGTASFATNDPANNPYTFILSGTVASAPPPGTALYVDPDTSTQGTWQGAYGAQGYDVAGGPSSLPSYARLTLSGEQSYTWAASTTDVRAPQSGTGRVAATWFSSSNFTVNVNLTDGGQHRLALYVLDWDNQGRSERIDVINPATGAVLNSQTVSSFQGGEYLVWDVSGNVQFKITSLAGPNAVLSGVFLDPASVSQSPVAQVLDGTTAIADGTGSDSFGSTQSGTPVSKTFSVTNTGTGTLTLGSAITVPSGFAVTAGFGSTSLAPGGSTTFTVQMTAVAAGSPSGTISFATNDPNNNPYKFTISGTVTAPAVPSVQVRDGLTAIADNTGSDSFGTALAGTPVSKTFTVTNSGTSILQLGSTITLPVGFTLTSGFGISSLTPGASTTFIVQMTAAAAGTYSGQVSFATNDPANNPFTFTVSGAVTTTAPKDFQIIDDSASSGFTTTSGWVSYSGQGLNNDVHYAAAGNGSQVATWTFAVASGQYTVAATWFATSNRATNAPYTVLDGATALGTVKVNQQLVPGDFTDQGVGWKNLGTFTFTGNTLVVQLSNAANQYVIADAIRIQRVGPITKVRDGSTVLTSGTSIDSFGSARIGDSVSRTFTVMNKGVQPLILGPTIVVPTGFIVTSGFGSTTLAPGTSTTFTIQLDTAAMGSFGGTVSFATNDLGSNPFQFTVNGTVGPVQIIDDSAASGFTTTAGWSPWAGQGLGIGMHYAAPGDGSLVATWTFAVAPGTYRVSVTWPAQSNRATNAPYTVLDGTTSLGTVAVNQQLPPSGFSDQAVTWQDLGTFTITGNTLVVQLSNAANGFVIADAVRIQRVA
jgi:hypothetical protein